MSLPMLDGWCADQGWDRKLANQFAPAQLKEIGHVGVAASTGGLFQLLQSQVDDEDSAGFPQI